MKEEVEARSVSHEAALTLADAILGECDCCHEAESKWDLTWTGKQMLCARCAD